MPLPPPKEVVELSFLELAAENPPSLAQEPVPPPSPMTFDPRVPLKCSRIGHRKKAIWKGRTARGACGGYCELVEVEVHSEECRLLHEQLDVADRLHPEVLLE